MTARDTCQDSSTGHCAGREKKRWTEEEMGGQRKRIVETAAAIIQVDIRSCVFRCDAYPRATYQQEIAVSMIPETLSCLVDGVMQPRTESLQQSSLLL